MGSTINSYFQFDCCFKKKNYKKIGETCLKIRHLWIVKDASPVRSTFVFIQISKALEGSLNGTI
jgi:hypothetical protein